MPHDADHLSPEFVDAVARRLLELARRKLTVADVARLLDIHPTWVYAHADQLGAIRLGPGPKAPLRFDPDDLDRAFRTLRRTADEPTVDDPQQQLPIAGGPAARARPASVSRDQSPHRRRALLPIRGDR